MRDYILIILPTKDKTMVVALVAEGSNSVRIPMMFWLDYNTALAQATNLLGETYNKNDAHWCLHYEHFSREEGVQYFFIGSEENWQKACETRPVPDSVEECDDEDTYRERCNAVWAAYKEAEKDWVDNLHLFLRKINSNALFTHYYGGCGECGGFSLETFEEGKPCVGFNLD